MQIHELCPYCSCPVSGDSITLWDGRAYCRKCVLNVSPELCELAAGGAPLEETLGRGDISALRCIAYIGKWHLVFVAIIFGLPFGLLVIAGKENVSTLIGVLLFFGGGGIAMFSLMAAIAAVIHRRRLPRHLSVERGEFKIAAPGESKSFKLDDCRWYFGSTANDRFAMFTRLKRGVVIKTPEAEYACGYAPEMLAHWRSFLTVARIEQQMFSGCFYALAIVLAGAAGGLATGTGLGYLAAFITNNGLWKAALGLMGVIDGSAAALIYLTCTSEDFDVAYKRQNPSLLAASFLMIGLMFVFLVGFPGVLICAMLNAAIGATVGWLCSRKITVAQLKHELAQVRR